MNVKLFSQTCIDIFNKSIKQYHITDSVDVPMVNTYSLFSIEYYLFLKNYIDSVQWHLEDIIRNPDIDPVEALRIKRRIDKSNQDRTELVETMDDYFFNEFKNIQRLPDAELNTETPAWAIDRLSILTLKIYHMCLETNRQDATPEHRESCTLKLNVLKEQQSDLTSAIDQLMNDIASGKKYMKMYKQMKMYNDPNLNPELYNKNK